MNAKDLKKQNEMLMETLVKIATYDVDSSGLDIDNKYPYAYGSIKCMAQYTLEKVQNGIS